MIQQKKNIGVTKHPRSLNSGKALAKAICSIIDQFIYYFISTRSMHDVRILLCVLGWASDELYEWMVMPARKTQFNTKTCKRGKLS